MVAEQELTRGRYIGASTRSGEVDPNRARFWQRIFHSQAKPKTPADGVNAGSSASGERQEATSDDYIIADILPDNPNNRAHVITYPERDRIMQWAEDPNVKGRIYQLESGPQDIYQEEEQRRFLYYDYYSGTRDDEGKTTLPENSTFYKAVNSKGKIIAVTTVRWKGVDFIKRGRTAYRERTIVEPDLRSMHIGLALGIRVLDDILYRSERYDGLPATGVESSIYTDRQAGPHNINHNYLSQLGFRKYKDPIIINGRQVQPYRLTLADYEEKRPDTIDHIRNSQPKMAEEFEKIWPELKARLRGKT